MTRVTDLNAIRVKMSDGKTKNLDYPPICSILSIRVEILGNAVMPNKSTFESRNLTSDVSLELKNTGAGTETPKFTGINKRHKNRRSSKDRRSEVRFEVNKPDRRENYGRRSDDSSPSFW